MKNFILGFATIFLFATASAQNEDPAGSISLSPVSMAAFTSLSPSSCGATVYNLGLSTSTPTPAPTSGTMANDVWFHFVAVAEVAKIKVCNPTTFDAAIEVWNSTATGASLGASNVGGSGAKEYLCVSGLTAGTTYKVRVGRVSGAGAGTFNISYEHLGVEVRNGWYPDPPGAATCYDFVTNIWRTVITYPVGATNWKFVDGSGNVLGPFALSYITTLAQVPGVCEGETYTVYCEVQANDPECGNIWWGYSTGRPITVCETICPTVTAAAGTITCGGTFCDIFNTAFGTSNIGNGFQYQFRFVTDNGSTDFCTAWQTSPFFQTSALPYTNYFRYSKIYSVYVRVKRCATDPAWCGPCTFTTCVLPYVQVNTSSCCKWRNKTSGGTVNAAGVNGMDQYRFRFTPIDPCSNNPFLPIGPAVTTNWTPSLAVNPGGLPLTLGSVYNVQVQCRVNPSTVTNCDGSTSSLSGQQSDWGLPCFIGFRSSSSPPVGSIIDCCISAMTVLEENDFLSTPDRYDDDTYDETDVSDIETTVAEPTLSLISASSHQLELNLEEAALYGDGVINVHNLSGQLVHSERAAALHTSNYLRIVTSNELPTGIYVVSVHSGYGNVSQKFFIHKD